jgi:hypothetical protein
MFTPPPCAKYWQLPISFHFKGWINTTIMFYSSYPAQALVSDDGETTYKLPLAYLLVGAAYLILSLLLMVSRYVQW